MNRRWLPLLSATLLATACDTGQREDPEPAVEEAATTSAGAVRVVARDYAFEAPTEVPSGWTTFHLENDGEEHHFVLLTRLPEGKTLADYGQEVGPAFGVAWDTLQAGAEKATAGAILGERLPEWYGSAVVMGGPGLLAPGLASRTTVKLDPGTYVMECYVKTSDGRFHVELGMVAPLNVVSEPSENAPPGADVEISLSNGEIAVEGVPSAGEQTVAVRFLEHPSVGLGNDVHVARIDDDTDLDELFRWMDWMEIDGLRAPAPVPFIGGAEEMPVGQTAYFTITLEPGRYAFVSESATEGMIEPFSVE